MGGHVQVRIEEAKEIKDVIHIHCEGSRLTARTLYTCFFLQDPGQTSTSGVTHPKG